MQIEDHSVVRFHYRLSDADGTAIEDSHDGEAASYLHGHGNIIPGLEAAMAGRRAGDTFSVTVAPEQGYGPRQADAHQRISMKAVMNRGKLVPGMVISVNTDGGPRQVTVVKPGRHVVDVDLNHPLAGRTLQFEVEIVEVREASAEERAHGHVHGPGGHHH